MGDIAEMMFDGTLCQICGVLMIEEGEDEAGYPVTCEACLGDEEAQGNDGLAFLDDDMEDVGKYQPPAPKTHACPKCARMFAGSISLRQHLRDRHKITEPTT